MAAVAFPLVWATYQTMSGQAPSLVGAAEGSDVTSLLDWLTAIGTVGAVVVALAFGIVAERRTRQDRRERAAELERAREAARRAQALRVAIWGHEDWSPAETEYVTDDSPVSIHIVNASDLPVVHVQVPGNPVWAGWSPQSLLPGEAKHVDLTLAELAGYERAGHPPDARGRLRVVFTDNAGTTWTRSFTGELWEHS
ncbi:hypothetical protein J1G42_01520 [Cellulomonas sp. zg-ZUI222]|uniref:Uncharacterized protein n=1 Tax=Cellulomonas wangleii TaxID=2816956 RepID=A0ABX8D4H0_9CELL|nr:hypothetical protein [Cellulomonas wangleii]MBO0919501.1 hypothetical protein [Cellulomonas wangleii]MBO0924359.1 hypothetical protein [Cellulomonas wangleii]QVI62361.1 hypothetical protein KG103_18500 [Cellulomonas wangleii]